MLSCSAVLYCAVLYSIRSLCLTTSGNFIYFVSRFRLTPKFPTKMPTDCAGCVFEQRRRR